MVAARIEWTEEERVVAIQKAAERFLERMAVDPGSACVWSLRDVTWPAVDRAIATEEWRKRATIVLHPLSRIGQMEGKSGSLVLIGQFEVDGLPPSNPLIVKTRNRRALGGPLSVEWDNAQAAKPHTYDRKDSFAIPVAFDNEDDGYEVLWSLCLPSVRPSEAARGETKGIPPSEDLRALLQLSPQASEDAHLAAHRRANSVLEKTYSVLRSLHRTAATSTDASLPSEVRTFATEYEWYLRNYGVADGSLWGPEWKAVWAASTERRIRGKMNPLWLTEQLRPKGAPMQLGVIHGDLHAGNIMIRDGDGPALIDFGWSKTSAHVAKDFVLMECNLRFLTLRPQLSEEALTAFCGWTAWENPPDVGEPYLARRAELIMTVRESAKKVLSEDTDWTTEYLIPLYLMAFGLLRFAPQLGNQVAAVRFVEALAESLGAALV